MAPTLLYSSICDWPRTADSSTFFCIRTRLEGHPTVQRSHQEALRRVAGQDRWLCVGCYSERLPRLIFVHGTQQWLKARHDPEDRQTGNETFAAVARSIRRLR
jgi:hypothetical protein